MHLINNPQSESHHHILFPVLLPVPAEVAEFKPKDRVIFLSRHAREALRISAEKSGVHIDKLIKNENGVPQPFEGTFWSVTHKTQYVAGVTAPTPTGIDVERIRSFSDGLFKKTASDREWALADMAKDPVTVFFRYWTAKEAVLKAVGKGMVGLSDCRIVAIVDADHLIVTYQDSKWTVAQYWGTKDHIVAVTADHVEIQWHRIE